MASILLRHIIYEGPDNHLCKAMIDVYATAAKIKGNMGTPKERLAKFEAEVTQLGGVWMKAHYGMAREFKMILHRERETLKKSVLDFFDGIHDKLIMLYPDNAVDDEAENELRQKLQGNLVLARKKLEGEIRPRLEACLGQTT